MKSVKIRMTHLAYCETGNDDCWNPLPCKVVDLYRMLRRSLHGVRRANTRKSSGEIAGSSLSHEQKLFRTRLVCERCSRGRFEHVECQWRTSGQEVHYRNHRQRRSD